MGVVKSMSMEVACCYFLAGRETGGFGIEADGVCCGWSFLGQELRVKWQVPVALWSLRACVVADSWLAVPPFLPAACQVIWCTLFVGDKLPGDFLCIGAFV